MLWDIDGVTFQTPPLIGINQVKYVEIIKGLAASNRYGSDGAGGVIIIKTAVSASKSELINSPKSLEDCYRKKKLKSSFVKNFSIISVSSIMKYFYIIPVFLLMTSVYFQDDPILKSQQNAISSMMAS